MSYNDLSTMKANGSLFNRIVAAAAAEQITNPEGWAGQYLWPLITQPGWQDAWAYAEDNKTINQNPDTGARTDVINDNMILGAVQAVKNNPPGA